MNKSIIWPLGLFPATSSTRMAYSRGPVVMGVAELQHPYYYFFNIIFLTNYTHTKAMACRQVKQSSNLECFPMFSNAFTCWAVKLPWLIKRSYVLESISEWGCNFLGHLWRVKTQKESCCRDLEFATFRAHGSMFSRAWHPSHFSRAWYTLGTDFKFSRAYSTDNKVVIGSTRVLTDRLCKNFAFSFAPVSKLENSSRKLLTIFSSQNVMRSKSEGLFSDCTVWRKRGSVNWGQQQTLPHRYSHCVLI